MMPESTYQLLLDAATAWPDGVATQWIPDPGDHTRCLSWTYAQLADTVTRIANTLTALGVRRQDAVTLSGANTSMLYAATLAAQAVGIAADAGPAGQRPLAAYLEDLIACQPADRLTGAEPPAAQDLASFVHTGGTTGAPKIAAQTHASQLACARGIAEASGLAPGEGMLGGLPLFHVNALIVSGIAPMFSGARVVWPGPAGYRDKALYARFWQVIQHYRIVAMSAVPTVYGAVTQVPVDADISSLRLPWAAAIDEPAARPRHVYPVDTIPLTAIGKQFKPALAADAAVRAVTDALAQAGLPGARVTSEHEDGQLVVTVAGADPARVRDAVAGFALTIRCGHSPAPEAAAR